MASIGIPGRRNFDVHKTLAKEMPHKWSATYLYRDYLRVLVRKYEGPKLTRMKRLLRESFVENSYINEETRMKTMGAGPNEIGTLAIEEEFFMLDRKHPEHPSRFEVTDILARNVDAQARHPLPYIVQRDVWFFFGVGEPQQDMLATKTHRLAESANEEYYEEAAEDRDQCREWMLDRLECFEESMSLEKDNMNDDESFSSLIQDRKHEIELLFEYLDSNGDGLVNYADYSRFLKRHDCYHSVDERISDHLFYSPDAMHMYEEGHYYMSDVLGVPASRYDLGWTLDEFGRAYLKHAFMDLDYHLSLMDLLINADLRRDEECAAYSKLSPMKKNHNNDSMSIVLPTDVEQRLIEEEKQDIHDLVMGQRCDRIYNLYCDVAFGKVPHSYLIVRHNMATAWSLNCLMFNPDDDHDAVTWEKLKEFHDKLGTPEEYDRAYEAQEIEPQDVLFYDMNEHRSEILDHIPEDWPMWAQVFEDRLQDLDDSVVDEYLAKYVKKKVTSPAALSNRANYRAIRNKMVSDFIWNRMESYMQPWMWKRFTNDAKHPVPAAIRSWKLEGEKSLPLWFSLLRERRLLGPSEGTTAQTASLKEPLPA